MNSWAYEGFAMWHYWTNEQRQPGYASGIRRKDRGNCDLCLQQQKNVNSPKLYMINVAMYALMFPSAILWKNRHLGNQRT